MSHLRTITIIPAGLWLLLLAYRRDLPLLLTPSTALVLSAAAIVAGLSAQVIPSCIDHGPDRNHRRRLWAIPLLFLAVQVSALVAIAAIPTLLGRPHLWATVLDIPSHWVARLILNLFVLSTISTLSGFALAVIRTVHHPPRVDVSTGHDLLTSLGLVTLLGLVGSILLYWHISLPDNLLMARALVALRSHDSPREALSLLHRLMEEHPTSSLVDTATFRAARILEEDLAQDDAAAELYRRILDHHPESPWCDDAAFGLLRIASRRPGGTSAVLRKAEELVRRWPSSPRASDALLIAIRAARARNRRNDAYRLLGSLKRDYPRSRTMEENAETYPWWNRLTVDLAREALIQLDESS